MQQQVPEISSSANNVQEKDAAVSPQDAASSAQAAPEPAPKKAAQVNKKSELIPSLEGKCVGNYRLVKRIGGGGFGDVYRAEHVELGNPFAIKVLHKHLANDQPFVERFRTEAMVLAGLQHENVVNVVDFGQDDGIGFFLVMEWLEGRTLHRVWRRKRNFPLSQIYALFSQLLDALDVAHQRGVVHRDMKPENLMLTRGSRGRTVVKIVDFGIATIVRGKQDGAEPSPQQGQIVGTPYYMSPEQASGRHHEVDGRADIYACGVILFELLTGRRLYPSKEPKQVLKHQINTPPPRLESIPGNHPYSPMLQAVLDRALAKDLNHRYSTAAEMFAEFELAMKAEGIEPDDREIDLSQLRGVASQTSLLALAVGAEAVVIDEGESVSTGAGYRGQKASPSGSLDAISGVEEPPVIQASRTLWFYSLGGIGVVTLLLLLLGLQPWQSGSAPKQTLALPPLLRPPTISKTETRKPLPAGRAANTTDNKQTDNKQTDNKGATKPDVRTTGKPTRSRRVSRKRRKIRRRRRRSRRRSRRSRRVAVRRVGPTRRLFVVSSPPAASVYVNGKFRGKTPVRIKLRQGESFQVQIKKKGFVTQKFRWQATTDQTRRAKLIEDIF